MSQPPVPSEPLPATALRPEATPPAAPTDAPHLLFEFTEERRFQLYAERRKGYSEAARAAYTRFHQTLIGLSAGGVVLSMTFLKDVGRAPESLTWLIGGWLAILMGGAAAFFGLITSGEADRERIKQIDCLATTSKCDESRANRLGKVTVNSNRIATILCLAGIVLLIRFATINVLTPRGDPRPHETAGSPVLPSSAAGSVHAGPQNTDSEITMAAPVSSSTISDTSASRAPVASTVGASANTSTRAAGPNSSQRP